MSKRFDFAAMQERARSRDAYWTERTIIEFTEELCRCMETQRITRADLARRMNVSPAFITKILRGNCNFTLETMTKLSRAVGSELRVHLQAEGQHAVWFECCAPASVRPPADVDLATLMAGYVQVPKPQKENRDDRIAATA